MSIWKNINGNYGKFFVVKLDTTKMNFSKTGYVLDSVINRPFNTFQEATEFRNTLKGAKYKILKR